MAAVEDLTLAPELADLSSLAQELRSRSLLGPQSRLPALNQLWQELLPKIARQWPQRPLLIWAEALSNALYHLCLTPGARPEDWLKRMQRGLAACPSLEQVLGLAEVCAWLAGLPERRELALHQLKHWPDALLEALFDSELPAAELRQGLQQSAWWHPERQTPDTICVHALGGFRGWGGPFLFPPELFIAPGQVWIQSGEVCWQIVADAFGAQLKRKQSLPPEAEAVLFPMPENSPFSERAQAHFCLPTSALHLAQSDDLCAVVSPQSFKLLVAGPPSAF